MRRDLAAFLVNHFENIFKNIVPATSCPDEDMFYWAAYQRGEGTVNSCIQMSDWSNTDKEWKSNAERCQCPKYLASIRMKAASCGRPSLWGGIRRDGLQEIFQSPAGYWLIRKFPGDKLPGRAQLIDSNSEQVALGILRDMKKKWEKMGDVDLALLEELGTDTAHVNHSLLEELHTHSIEGSNQEGASMSQQIESLDSATAKLIIEKRNKPHIALVAVTDTESERLQALRKNIDSSDQEKPDISGFPHWTTFNRIDTNGLEFGKTIGMLVTAFD
jgi:hypothetical protein